MKKKLIIILGIIVLCTLSWFVFFKKNNENVSFVLKEYSSTGKLLGINECFISNGDTIMHGKFENYNEKGVKISEGNFVNNDIYGHCYYYDNNGNLESKFFRKNSEIILESTIYNPKGFAEEYTICDNDGYTVFKIFFDEKGAKSYNGLFQLEIFQHSFNKEKLLYENSNNEFKIGDTLKYSYIVANIPNAKRSFTIENVGIDNAKVKRITKKVEPCQIDVKEVLTKKGNNTIRSIVRYEFNDKVTPIFIDTLSFDVKVY